MSIEITEFADVSISVTPLGVSTGNFGILGFLNSNNDTNANGEYPIPSSQRARAYVSLDGVLEDWDTSTEAAKAATTFYAQTPTPKDFVVLVMTGINYNTIKQETQWQNV